MSSSSSSSVPKPLFYPGIKFIICNRPSYELSNQPNVTWYNLEDVLKSETESKQVAYLLLKSTAWYADELILERVIRSVVGEWVATQQMHKTKEFEKETLEADFKTIAVTRYYGSSEMALYTIDRLAARLGWDKSKLQFQCHNIISSPQFAMRLPEAIVSFEIAAQIIADLHRYKSSKLFNDLFDECYSKGPRDHLASIVDELQKADYILQVTNSSALSSRPCLLFFLAGHMHVIDENGNRIFASYPLENKKAFKTVANSVYKAYESAPDVFTVLDTLVVNSIEIAQTNENIWIDRLKHAEQLKVWHETSNRQKVPSIDVVKPYVVKDDDFTNADFLARFKWGKTRDEWSDAVLFIRDTDNDEGMIATTIDSMVFSL